MSEVIERGVWKGMNFMLRPAPDHPAPLVLMLHGLTGDEGSMWVLETALPTRVNILSLRGSFPASTSGFSWIPEDADGAYSLDHFKPASEAVSDLILHLRSQTLARSGPLVLMGFSQGAAFAFALAQLDRNPNRLDIQGVITLAGFLPDGDLDRLEGLPVFWGHGSQDQLVPIESARVAVARLKRSGARVEFCEAAVGHKLGIECLRGVRQWMLDTFPIGLEH